MIEDKIRYRRVANGQIAGAPPISVRMARTRRNEGFLWFVKGHFLSWVVYSVMQPSQKMDTFSSSSSFSSCSGQDISTAARASLWQRRHSNFRSVSGCSREFQSCPRTWLILEGSRAAKKLKQKKRVEWIECFANQPFRQRPRRTSQIEPIQNSAQTTHITNALSLWN